MKIWFDILSPKQLFLFTSVADEVKKFSHKVFLTSRKYVQLDDLIDGAFGNWKIAKIGRWGGRSLESKLKASIERMSALLDYVLEIDPDVCLSSGSPEAARICYGLGIPHLIISDTPHSPINRLSAPLSEKILTPWVIPREEWIEAGAREESIVRYKSLDPCFWLRRLDLDKRVLRKLGLEEGKYVFLRMPETQASYLKASDESFIEVINFLAEKIGNMRLVVSCRYPEQSKLMRKSLRKENVTIIDELLPGPSIIFYSAFFIGGGGTMTQEAALLGIPSISIYPHKLPTVLDFLRRRMLIVRCEDPRELADLSLRILTNVDEVKKEWKRRAEDLWKLMEDPMKVVLRELGNLS